LATVEMPISVTTILVYNDTIFGSLWWRYNQVLLYIETQLRGLSLRGKYGDQATALKIVWKCENWI
jgi:hypothetical protein